MANVLSGQVVARYYGVSKVGPNLFLSQVHLGSDSIDITQVIHGSIMREFISTSRYPIVHKEI